MIKTYGAPIPEATAKKITAYLAGHYAPEKGIAGMGSGKN
jgi:hypothetical protein